MGKIQEKGTHEFIKAAGGCGKRESFMNVAVVPLNIYSEQYRLLTTS